MMENDVIRVLSLSTPHPKRVHLMDKYGDVLCDNKHLRFCHEEAHRGFTYGIFVCTPCAAEYRRMLFLQGTQKVTSALRILNG